MEEVLENYQKTSAGRFIAAEQVAPGTVVICALAKGVTHHSGIWLGDGTIAEFDGDGNYRAVDLQTFLRGNAVLHAVRSEKFFFRQILQRMRK